MSRKVSVELSVCGKFELSYVEYNSVQMGVYKYWSITGTEIINEWNGVHSYNHGKEKYIRKIWNKRFANA